MADRKIYKLMTNVLNWFSDVCHVVFVAANASSFIARGIYVYGLQYVNNECRSQTTWLRSVDPEDASCSGKQNVDNAKHCTAYIQKESQLPLKPQNYNS